MNRIDKAQHQNRINFDDQFFDAKSINEMLTTSVQDLIRGKRKSTRDKLKFDMSNISIDKLRRGSQYPIKEVLHEARSPRSQSRSRTKSDS